MKETKTEPSAPLTIAQAAALIAQAGLWRERTARDKLNTRSLPMNYRQQGKGCKVWLDAAEVAAWIKQQTPSRHGN